MNQAGQRRHTAGSFVLSPRRIPALAFVLAGLSLAASAQAPVTDHLVHLGQSAPGTVSVYRVGYVYHLSFVGDETIDYQINLGDHPTTKGILRVYESSSDSWPLMDGGVGYRPASGIADTPQYLAQYTVLENYYKTANSFVMEFADTAEGGSHHRRYTFTIVGKSLTIRVQDMDGNQSFASNFCGLLTYPTQGMENPTYLKIQGALATPLLSFMHGAQRWYYGEMLDMPASNSADYFLDTDPVVPGSSSVLCSMSTFNGYKRSSTGKLSAPLDDTISITISSHLRDVLVTPTQPPSPYRGLLTGRMMFNFAGNNWVDYVTLWNLFQTWGLDDVAGYFFTWSSSAPDSNNDNVGPDWYPATNSPAFATMTQSGAARGFLLGGYMAFNIMPPTAPPAIYNASHIARDDFGLPKLGIQVPMPLIAATASEIHAARESQLVKTNYGMNMAYLDIQSYSSPSKGADGDHIDQQQGSRFARSLSRAIYEQKRWMRRMADTLEGPLVGEGSIATRDSQMEWLWSGYCDSVQRVINTDTGQGASQMQAGDPGSPTSWPVIPEFELRVMDRMQANHGNGFPDRFFSRSDGPGFVNMSTGQPLYPMNEAQLDRYRAYEISYGKSSFIQCNGPYDGIGNYTYLSDVVKEYYAMNELQTRYYASPISTVEYFDAGVWKTVEQMIAQSGTSDSCKDPWLRLRYTNGLEVYVNHKPASWAITVNGTNYTIPEDGYFAWQPGTSFISFSAIAPTTGGQRIDYCLAPNRYEFFDGRGQVNGYGGIDTGGIKKLRVRNDVHATTAWETAAGPMQSSQGTAPNAVSVVVSPTGTTLALGQRIGLHAIATFSNGSYRDVTTLVNWSSSNPAVVRVNEAAALTALALGSATITCTSFGGASVTPATVNVP